MTRMLKALQKIQAKGEHLAEAAPSPEMPPPTSQPTVTAGNALFVGLHGIASSVPQEVVVCPVQPDASRTSRPPANSMADPSLVVDVDVRPSPTTAADSVHSDPPDTDVEGLESTPSPHEPPHEPPHVPPEAPPPQPAEAPPGTHAQECDLSERKDVTVTEVLGDDRATAGQPTACMRLGDADHADAFEEQEPVRQPPVDQPPVDQQFVDRELPGQEPVDATRVDPDRSDRKPIESEPVDLEPTNVEPGSEEPIDHEPIDHKSVPHEMSGNEQTRVPLADSNSEAPPATAPGFTEQLRDIPAFASDIESAKTWVLDDEPRAIGGSSRSDIRDTAPEEAGEAMQDPLPGDGEAGGHDPPDADANVELAKLRRDAEVTEEIRLLDEIEELLLPEDSALWSASDDVDELLSDDELDGVSDFPTQIWQDASAEDEGGENGDQGCAVAPETARDNSPCASETESSSPNGDGALPAPSANWSDNDAPRIDARTPAGPPSDVVVAPHPKATNTAVSSPLPSGATTPDGPMAIEILHTTLASALAAENAVEFASPARSSPDAVPVPAPNTFEMTDFELDICSNLNEAKKCADYDTLWSNISTTAGPAGRLAAAKRGLFGWLRQRTPVDAPAEEVGERPRSLVFASVDSQPDVADILAHLAIYLTTRCQLRVLLVDADLDGAMLSERFGAAREASTGVSELCRGEATVPTLHQTATGLTIVSAGASQIDGLELQPERVARFVTSQTPDYDIILVDGGACQGPLFHGLAASCDRRYLLTQLGKSAREQAATQVRTLRASGVRLNGCVVTNAPAAT